MTEKNSVPSAGAERWQGVRVTKQRAESVRLRPCQRRARPRRCREACAHRGHPSPARYLRTVALCQAQYLDQKQIEQIHRLHPPPPPNTRVNTSHPPGTNGAKLHQKRAAHVSPPITALRAAKGLEVRAPLRSVERGLE